MTQRPRIARPEALFDLRLARNHAVMVLVSVVDRRIVPALRFVSRLGYADTRAVHVSVDPDETLRLARDWMELGLSWLPLHVHDAVAGGLPASVVEAVREETAGTPAVTVVLPEYDTGLWWHPFLHRGTARRIAAALQGDPGLTPIIVPFSARPVSRGGSRTGSPSPPR